MTTVQGSCHCQAVRFEIEADVTQASRCNCNICQRTGSTSVIVKPNAFRLLAGKESLTSYTRFPQFGQRYFCSKCGIHTHGDGDLPELGGKFVSVNANCFDKVDPSTLEIGYWDGRHDNWQAGLRDKPWPHVAVAS